MRRKGSASAALAVVLAMSVLAGPRAGAAAESYLVVWAGDVNAGDRPGSGHGPGADLPGPDFLAVVGAAPGSHYGRVLRTLPVDGLENEPHHMQYTWNIGDRVFAGGLFSDRTFVFDVDAIPEVSLVGVVEPADTPCGSVPDAYWVLADGTAYGTYMGGPNLAGDPRCNGGINNGFAGTPGTVVRIGRDAQVLGEFPATGDPGRPFANDAGRPARCASNPPLARASCANPHGIQAREDLGVMITSDYAEPRNVPIDPLQAAIDPNVFRDTVRVWDIRDLDHPRLRSVSVMPTGSMAFDPPPTIDPRGVMGIMETTVTNLPGHRGAFASSMCGGQIYYSADITSHNPMWRQVFDVNAAAALIDPRFAATRVQGCVGAGWLQTSPDDKVLFQAVIGRQGTGGADLGVPKMVYALDISALVSQPVEDWYAENPEVCTISSASEVFAGGAEAMCPRPLSAVALPDATSGGPHWGAIDPFTTDGDPGRATSVTRIAVSNYFVARSGIDGNHRVCMVSIDRDGRMSIDGAFRDAGASDPCVSFDRSDWPHGAHGPAKPHSMLFVVPPT